MNNNQVENNPRMYRVPVNSHHHKAHIARQHQLTYLETLREPGYSIPRRIVAGGVVLLDEAKAQYHDFCSRDEHKEPYIPAPTNNPDQCERMKREEKNSTSCTEQPKNSHEQKCQIAQQRFTEHMETAHNPGYSVPRRLVAGGSMIVDEAKVQLHHILSQHEKTDISLEHENPERYQSPIKLTKEEVFPDTSSDSDSHDNYYDKAVEAKIQRDKYLDVVRASGYSVPRRVISGGGYIAEEAKSQYYDARAALH